jgi:peroxiredoxin
MSRLRHLTVRCLLAGVLAIAPLQAMAMAGKGKPAPAFSLTTVTNQKLDLASLRGKVIIADFFATWCSPCREAIPHLVDLQRRLGSKGLQVVGLSADDEDDVRTVREFVTSYQINYPVALAPPSVQGDYGLRAVPVLYVIDKKGVVVEVFRGLSGDLKKRMEDLILKLLAQ